MTNTTWQLDTGDSTHTGGRDSNQDTLGSFRTWRDSPSTSPGQLGELFVVADGAGGHADGARASSLTVQAVLESYYIDPEGDAPSEPLARLIYAIERANRIVTEDATRRGSDMASTVVATLACPDQVFVANIGDSPAYLCRPGTAPRAMFVSHRDQRSGGLLQWVGTDRPLHVTCDSAPFHSGDVIVLATDGLSDSVTPDEIAEVATAQPAQDAARELVALAVRRNGRHSDNVTVLVLRNGAPPKRRARARRSYRSALTALGVMLLLGLVLVYVLRWLDTSTIPTVAVGLTASPAAADIAAPTIAPATATLRPTAPPTTPTFTPLAATAPAAVNVTPRRPPATSLSTEKTTSPFNTPPATELPPPTATPSPLPSLTATPSQEHRIPQIIGLRASDAQRLIRAEFSNQVLLQEGGQPVSDTLIDYYLVVSSIPGPGEPVSADAAIVLGLRPPKMPRAEGLTVAEFARTFGTTTGYSLTRVVLQVDGQNLGSADDSAYAGYIIRSTEPAAGQPLRGIMPYVLLDIQPPT